jgi:hypothetical protein
LILGRFRLPPITECAHTLTHADRQRRNRFDALLGGNGKIDILPAQVTQQKFGIAENPGERIVQLVPQNFTEVSRSFGSCGRRN